MKPENQHVANTMQNDRLKCRKYSKYCAKWKVNMPKCGKHHATWQVLVCCKYKANGITPSLFSVLGCGKRQKEMRQEMMRAEIADEMMEEGKIRETMGNKYTWYIDIHSEYGDAWIWHGWLSITSHHARHFGSTHAARFVVLSCPVHDWVGFRCATPIYSHNNPKTCVFSFDTPRQ